MKWLVTILSGVVGALALFSCSLQPMGSSLALQANADRTRDLSELTHFAIAATSGVSDSLTSAIVKNRSLVCLNATGQIAFPYTLSQLKSGASVAIVPGSHRFTILGFKGVSGQPTSVAQLFSDSPSLQAFVVAQVSANTLTTSSVAMQSTYISGVTTDLLVACPFAAQHAIYNISGGVHYTKNAGTDWVSTPIVNGANESLFVDNQGVAHALVGSTTLRYLNNRSGGFTYIGAEVTNAAVAVSGIALTSLGAVNVLAGRAGVNTDARVFTRDAAGTWSDSVAVLTTPNNFTELHLRIGPEDTLLAFGTKQSIPAFAQVNTKAIGGVWGTAIDIVSAGSQTCSSSTSNISGAVDSVGNAHVIYRCQVTTAPDKYYLGYATNRTGSWMTSAVGTATDSLGFTSLAIDASNNLHAIYVVSNAAYYRTLGNNDPNGWGSAVLIYTAASIGAVAIGGASSTPAGALLDITEGSTQSLRAFTYSGGWQSGQYVLTNISGFRLFPLIYYR